MRFADLDGGYGQLGRFVGDWPCVSLMWTGGGEAGLPTVTAETEDSAASEDGFSTLWPVRVERRTAPRLMPGGCFLGLAFLLS